MTESEVSAVVLWLRAEYKPFEQRTLVTPGNARKLLDGGYKVVVEDCPQRMFPISDYQEVGCRIVPKGAWREAPATAIVLGLKELDNDLGPFTHRHVHFAHVYKEQSGWQDTLRAFTNGGGTLYDLEYLVDEQNRRVAAFGYWAGFVGAACAVLAYTSQIANSNVTLAELKAWTNKDVLIEHVRASLASCAKKPSALVIGALGRCGSGAVELLETCALASTAWDQHETRLGGPFDQILEHDLLINCVFVNAPTQPFTTLAHLTNSERRLRVIADVSCDPFGQHNPIPIYEACTTMDNPVTRLAQAADNSPPLDLLAIDHLPSLLPRESSEDFSAQMLPHLMTLAEPENAPWAGALELFETKISQLS